MCKLHRSNFHCFDQPDLPIPPSYTLSLEELDGLDSLSRVEVTAIKEQPNQLVPKHLVLYVRGLQSRRLWNITIYAFGCQEHSILRGEILSKFPVDYLESYNVLYELSH